MLLAIDTSTRFIGIALYDGMQVVSESSWLSHDYHTVELAPAAADILNRAGIQAGNLQAVAVALGPGSFTGLRIGIALAKGVALANRLPLVGVPTLDVLAYGQEPRSEPMAAILRAGRGRLAVAWYKTEASSWQRATDLAVMSVVELAESIKVPTYVCGELDEEERRFLSRRRQLVILASPAQSVRRPAVLAEIGWQRWKSGKASPAHSLTPIYLHYNDPIPGVSS